MSALESAPSPSTIQCVPNLSHIFVRNSTPNVRFHYGTATANTPTEPIIVAHCGRVRLGPGQQKLGCNYAATDDDR